MAGRGRLRAGDGEGCDRGCLSIAVSRVVVVTSSSEMESASGWNLPTREQPRKATGMLGVHGPRPLR